MLPFMMARRSGSFGATLASLAVVAACGGGLEPDPPVAGTGGGGGGAGIEPKCTPGTRWDGVTPIFREVTSEWAFGGVYGQRFQAVDFDGDGWTDVVVHKMTNQADDLFEAPACCAADNCPEETICPSRHTWLMRNTGKGGFEDVTLASGFVAKRSDADPQSGRPFQVVAFADIDNDGDLDAYTGRTDASGSLQPETSEVMLNDGNGKFVLGPAESALRVVKGDAPAGASFVDYDRNGTVDLWVPQNAWAGSPSQDQLYWGHGDGAFTNVTAVTGLETKGWSDITTLNEGRAHSWAWSALACDLNDDGDLELLASSYGRAPNHLWQATGAAGGWTFTNRSVVSGYAYDARTEWSDDESARCYCKLEPQAADCADVPPPMYIKCDKLEDAFRWDHNTSRELFRLGGNSGGTMCGDIDNDGDMDLLTTEIVHWDVGSSSDPAEILVNTGEADVRFERPGNAQTGVVRDHDIVSWNDGDMSGALFDFDNDGWLDIYLGDSDYPGSKGRLFHHDSSLKFVLVPYDLGIDHNRSHGIVAADFDRDGDLDVIVGHSHMRCENADDCYPTQQARVFENLIGQAGNWFQLVLSGSPGTNRAAIGARVTVRTPDGVVRAQEVGGGHGQYGAQQDLTVHVGLGSACTAEVTVRWPDAVLSEETFDVAAGYRFGKQQGEPLKVLDAAEDGGR
jgi:hypothetical protein